MNKSSLREDMGKGLNFKSDSNIKPLLAAADRIRMFAVT
jgi:hypothetical protein